MLKCKSLQLSVVSVKRNTDLYERCDSALQEANSLKEKGIVTIKDLSTSIGLSLGFR